MYLSAGRNTANISALTKSVCLCRILKNVIFLKQVKKKIGQRGEIVSRVVFFPSAAAHVSGTVLEQMTFPAAVISNTMLCFIIIPEVPENPELFHLSGSLNDVG